MYVIRSSISTACGSGTKAPGLCYYQALHGLPVEVRLTLARHQAPAAQQVRSGQVRAASHSLDNRSDAPTHLPDAAHPVALEYGQTELECGAHLPSHVLGADHGPAQEGLLVAQDGLLQDPALVGVEGDHVGLLRVQVPILRADGSVQAGGLRDKRQEAEQRSSAAGKGRAGRGGGCSRVAATDGLAGPSPT